MAPNTCGDGTGCDNMTAIIVQFKPSKSSESTSVEVTSVAKKRPMSPNASAEANECTNEDNVKNDCKKSKTETC